MQNMVCPIVGNPIFTHWTFFGNFFTKTFFILFFFDFQGKVTSSKTRKSENARYMV